MQSQIGEYCQSGWLQQQAGTDWLWLRKTLEDRQLMAVTMQEQCNRKPGRAATNYSDSNDGAPLTSIPAP